MVGKLHKKKISEYAEAAENEEKQQNDEKADEGEETIEDKDDDQVSGSESDTGDGANNENNKSRDSMTNNEETAGDETGDNEDEDKLPDSNDPEDSEPENGKKGKKRKAAERAARKDGATEEDSDDEPLNGTVNPKKKGRKSATNSGGGSKGKKNMKSGGKGKQSKKSAPKVDDEEEEEAEYEVKDIVGHKIERGISYFLIRWKGYTKDDDTWEPEDTLNCPDIIDKYKKKQAINSPKKGGSPAKKGKGNAKNISIKPKEDPNKEWEVEKIIDYAEEKAGRVFRIRWKGFGPKHDTWEPEKNLNCNDIIQKFMKRMKSQENVSFKELREEPKKTKRLVNETALRTNLNNPIGRKSKRSSAKKRVFYGDMDD
ncbi:chromodomain-helicase-DNA-binding protein 1 isoform X2 [Glossina fuscipes]|uniref:Chromodomain-helicase-DNA-binding protein 1 isoform X2 n=1 Tax=Glossina fuscipes TaxID=7396 RepID=A0A9C5Z044_9MUSC|nr:chromodomain-helicase-DNA-binding protein 1 isoform X2 [Glossina fuscipes]KAI9582070.1 hypothetical protein GQX74_011565 [Glossina fuscipes]